VSQTSPTSSVPAFGPADWQARRNAGVLELSRPDRTLVARLTLYAVLFLSAVATVFDGPFVIVGVVAAMGVPLILFARMQGLSVAPVLTQAHRIVVSSPERVEAHYREAAVSGGGFAIDGERFDPEEVELLRVHRIHRTGEHMHRTHHVWLRTPDRIFELGAFPLPAEADELTHFLRAHLPELSGAGESSKADTLPHDAKAVAVTVVAALVAWGTTFAAPFLSWGVSPAIHAAVLFAIGVGMLVIEAVHGWLVVQVSDSLVRSLRRRYRLGR